MRHQRIPMTDSIRELAAFWDAHDVTDFDDELEEVTEAVFQLRSQAALEIHLGQSEVAAVKRLAESRGLGSAELIEQWVRQKVHES